MREWLSAAEWAAQALPGIPTTESATIRRAKREGWQRRERAGKGGGWEYHHSSLPPAARQAWVLRHAAAAPAPAAPAEAAGQSAPERAESWAHFERLPDKRKEEARRRLRLLQAVEALIEAGASKGDAQARVAEQSGEHAATLRRWAALVRSVPRCDWLPALAPRWTGRTAEVECPPEAWEYLKADWLTLSRPPLAASLRRLRRVAKERGWELPSDKTLQRRLERDLPPETIVLAREGPEALKRRFPAQERDRSVFHALQAVNADGHTFDLFVRWPDGSIERPKAVVWQDLRSGKILSWRVDRTENADAVRLSFGDLVERWGIPDQVYLDNGRGFAAKWLTGGMVFRYRFKVRAEEPAGIFRQLDIGVHWTTPYHGQAKPIERAFRDWCGDIARHPSFVGAYTGNSPTAKPENYGSRAIPLADFLRVLEQEVVHHNARPKRRSRICGGLLSFDQAFAESYESAPVRQATEAQRRLWLLAAEGVSASPVDGAIRLMGNRYWSERLGALAGRKLVVRFDPQRLHQDVHVYRLDGVYVGAAACLQAAGFNDTQAAREHGRARKNWLKHQKGLLAAERRMSAAEAAAMLPEPEETPEPEKRVVRPVFGNTALQVEPEAEAAPAEGEQEAFWANLSRNVNQLRRAQLLGDD